MIVIVLVLVIMIITGSLDNDIREFSLALSHSGWWALLSHYTMLYKYSMCMSDFGGAFLFLF